jgi:glyoxylase-like metal-dependent hydrolase (beta-lactamase superfamily II)
MYISQVAKNVFLIDLKTGGYDNLIGSYVVKGEKIAIIDCGPASSAATLLHGLDELGIPSEDVALIALTHVHVDHSGGSGLLLTSLPNAKVLVHSLGANHLRDPTRLWQATKTTLGYVSDIFGPEPEAVPKEKIIIASEGLTIDLGGASLKVIDAPGHAAHNLSYFYSAIKGLFPGDSAGAYLSKFDVVVPTTPPPFRPDVELITLDRLIDFSPQILFYPHFGVTHNAVPRLNTYAAQIKTWLRITKETIKEGENIENLKRRLFTEDETIPAEIREKVLTALLANKVHRKTLFGNSVEGFWEYAKNPAM